MDMGGSIAGACSIPWSTKLHIRCTAPFKLAQHPCVDKGELSYLMLFKEGSRSCCKAVSQVSGVPQAAYQAALTQQAAAAQQLLLQQQGTSQYMPPPPPPNFGHGGYSEALAAQVAAQLSLTPNYFNNPNINAAAAAAAAAAVQNIMSEYASLSIVNITKSCPACTSA